MNDKELLDFFTKIIVDNYNVIELTSENWKKLDKTLTDLGYDIEELYDGDDD